MSTLACGTYFHLSVAISSLRIQVSPQKPRVTVNYFNVDFDVTVQITSCRLARKIHNHAAFGSISSGETDPGINAVPDDGNGGSNGCMLVVNSR